jgi:hypothetical protein
MGDLIEQYTCVLEDLKRERERTVRAFDHVLKSKDNGIAEVERRLRALTGEAPDVEVKSQAESPTTSKNPYSMMTRAEAAVEFLRSKGQPQKTGVIAAALTAGGLHSPYMGTYKSLLKRSEQKDSDVVRLGKRGWGLTEWQSQSAAA